MDHNDDKVMEWEEFTGFIIDQVLALTREPPQVECLKVRQLEPRHKVSLGENTAVHYGWLKRVDPDGMFPGSSAG